MTAPNEPSTLVRRALARALEGAVEVPGPERLLEDFRAFAESARVAICSLPASGTEPGIAFESNISHVLIELDAERMRLVGMVQIQRSGTHYQHDFDIPFADKEAGLPKAVARALMASHPLFSEGVSWGPADPELPPDSGERAMRDFVDSLPGAGPVGAALRDALEEEGQWCSVREATRWRLADAIGECARSGLLPATFERSRLYLSAGCPGEPLLLTGWTVVDEGDSVHSSYSRGVDLLQARREVHGPDREPWWRLPSLDQGFDAIWDGLCLLIGQAHAAGWPRVEPRALGPDHGARAASAVLAQSLSDASPQPPPSRLRCAL